MPNEDEHDEDPIDSRGFDVAYETVARRLERRIRSGELRYHMPLPSEPALADWYGVSRTTIRSGIEVLIEKGMLERRRGKGTYVTWLPDLDASQDASLERGFPRTSGANFRTENMPWPRYNECTRTYANTWFRMCPLCVPPGLAS